MIMDSGQWIQTMFMVNFPYLSWEIHSKSFTLITFSSISLAATSLAWTSITMRADSTARCILDSFPRTRATRSLSCAREAKVIRIRHSKKFACWFLIFNYNILIEGKRRNGRMFQWFGHQPGPLKKTHSEFPTLPLTTCATLEKSFSFFILQLPIWPRPFASHAWVLQG